MPPNWLWGYLLPIGLLLLTWGGLPPQKARRITPLAALCIALAAIGYWALGFALHLGGAHAVNPGDQALQGLDMLFAPSGGGWGLLGLTGFFLSGDEITPTAISLFLAYLPLVTAAVLMVVLALADMRRWVIVLAGTLMGTLIFPTAACWIWGSGWLAHLGETSNLGHGVVDFGGSALVLWLPATMVCGVVLLQKKWPAEPLTPVPVYFPLLAHLGALLMGLGWMGWAVSGPFHTSGAMWDWNQAALSMILGMAGAVLTSQLYAWLVTGELESLLAARGLAAGWGAVLACAPFLPPWAALIIGLLAGLLFPFVLYAAESRLGLRSPATALALGLAGGAWGLLCVGLFADGRWGQGWNGVGAALGGNDLPLGISGLITRGDWQQLVAQIVGLGAIGVWGLLWGLGLGFVANPQLPQLKQAAKPALKETQTTDAEESPDPLPQDQKESDDETGIEDEKPQIPQVEALPHSSKKAQGS